MKLTTYIILAYGLVLAMACSKQEVAQPETTAVVRLNVKGNSTVDLEYLYKDSIIATSLAVNGGIGITQLIAVAGEDAEFLIRKKGTNEIIGRKTVTKAPFDQTISLYYDGQQLYDKSVLLGIRGFALAGELEFLIDGKVVYTGSGVITSESIPILINNNTTKEVQVRKKGETETVLTRAILPDPDRQTLRFFFDGSKMVDNIELVPPANPANMMVSAKFQTNFPAYFKNVDVDLVFYRKNIATNTAEITSPELRFTLPADGSFNNIELPPLPDPKAYYYCFDIYEKGTNTVPYNSTKAPFILAAFPFQQNLGRTGDQITFVAGKSVLWLIKDVKTVKATPTKTTMLSGAITDLSGYFQ